MKKTGCFVLCLLLFVFALSMTGALAEAAESDYAITLTADAETVTAGQQVTLTAAFANPETVNKKAKNDTIIWTLTDAEGNKTNAATIRNNGVVATQKNVKETTVVVAAAAAKSMESQTASVKITIVPCVSKITVTADPDIIYLQDGYNTVQLTAAVEPEDAAKDVTWKSSNEKVITVDEKGLVTAVAAGNATVTATANDGSNIKGNVKVTVGIPVGRINGISYNGAGSSLLAGKDSRTFSVSEFCDAEGQKINPTNKNVTWSIEVMPESALPYIHIDEKGRLTTEKDCPPASVKVTAAADGSLPAGSATYSIGDLFIAPTKTAETVEIKSMDDLYGSWSVFMTADDKGNVNSASGWMSKNGLYDITFEVIEANGKPGVFCSYNYYDDGSYYVCLNNGAVCFESRDGGAGPVLFRLCADGTMIQNMYKTKNDQNLTIYCIQTSKDKRVIETENKTDTGNSAEPELILGGLQTRDINGSEVDSSLIADKKLVMVNVWATYCQPCINEMKGLGSLSRELAEQGVMILGIVTDCQKTDLSVIEEKLQSARKIAGDTKADYPHLLASDSIYQNVVSQVTAVPLTFFVDGTGRMVGEVYVGARDEAEWKEIILATLETLSK